MIDGIEISVHRPSVLERVFVAVMNVLGVRGWLRALIDHDPTSVGRPMRSGYWVVARNRSGKERTISFAQGRDQAEQLRAEIESELLAMGVEAWAERRRGQLPAEFFD